jgi:hypothetical protein
MQLNPEEFKKLSQIQNRGKQFIIDLGSVEMDLVALQESKNKILENFRNFKAEEKEFFQILSYKYGEATIDILTGEITPKQEDQSS